MFKVSPYDPSLKISYEEKTRQFSIKEAGAPATVSDPIGPVTQKVRAYTTEEVGPETALERIYMEIAYQSRIFNGQTYEFRVKCMHDNILKGAPYDRTLHELIQDDPLNHISCRSMNEAEQNILGDKLKNTK